VTLVVAWLVTMLLTVIKLISVSFSFFSFFFFGANLF
jgi:hypothetical protein